MKPLTGHEHGIKKIKQMRGKLYYSSLHSLTNLFCIPTKWKMEWKSYELGRKTLFQCFFLGGTQNLPLAAPQSACFQIMNCLDVFMLAGDILREFE